MTELRPSHLLELLTGNVQQFLKYIVFGFNISFARSDT